MAIVCTLLGPLMVLMSGMIHASIAALDYLQSQPGMEEVEMLPMHHLVFGFADRSLWYLIGLGVAFSVTGIIALKGGRIGRLALLAAGWIGIAGMVVLTVVWVLEVVRLEMHFAWNVLGIVLHGVQAAAMVKGILYLSSKTTVAALES